MSRHVNPPVSTDFCEFSSIMDLCYWQDMHHNGDQSLKDFKFDKLLTHKDKISIFHSAEQVEIVTCWVYVVSRNR